MTWIRSSLLVVSLALTPLALAACARADSPGGPGESLPSDRTFVATAATQGSAPKQLAPHGRIELRFKPDGTLSAASGCNSIGATARLEAGRLMIDRLSVTDKACDEALTQQESWLTDMLSAGPAWKLTGDELTLRAGESELRLTDRKVADPDRPLAGPRWVFTTVLDGQSAGSVPSGVHAYFTIRADGSVTGKTGCNSFGGKATLDGGTVSMPDVVSTKMACNGPADEFERRVLKVLAQKLTYRIEANRLTLTGPDGAGYELRTEG